MKKKWYLVTAIIIASLMLGIFTSSVEAGSSEQQIINAVKNNPCVSYTYNSGGSLSS